MVRNKYKVLKIIADKIITQSENPMESDKTKKETPYSIDLDNMIIYNSVVEELLFMEDCALFEQFRLELNEKNEQEEISRLLLNQFVIVDFTRIYKGQCELTEEKIQALVEKGFYMKYQEKEIYMLPFDKSGSMSRVCRLSFINAKHLDGMNLRLNLGIDFGKQSVKLSKYYAYRGLYLSTARRISGLEITQETVVVVKDLLEKKEPNYQRAIFYTGIPEEDPSKIDFVTEEKKEDIDVPFDGQGIISPAYAKIIREKLAYKQDVYSFQIRLPFTKGMLHQVDFHSFLEEYDNEGYQEDKYIIKDAFGKERDLKKAKIIITKSMFKCCDWLKEICGEQDPMEIYCNAVKNYKHALYVSLTDLPYGKSRVAHTSYQLLNTLNLTEEQFNSLIEKQLDYVKNPVKYIEMTKGYCADDEDKTKCHYSNWQKALLVNPAFAKLPYIKNQLKNTQAALMTKLVLGKLVVKGQTRYMVRDLPQLLVNLIQDQKVKAKWIDQFKVYHYRFYFPQGEEERNEMGLEYNTYCGFYRSPHLSRNEQILLAPIVLRKESQSKYKKEVSGMHKYFGHLTGVVVFGNESMEPMALGGADFDGDLVTMIMDEDVVEAIKSGVYDKKDSKSSLDIDRKLPYIAIPSIKEKEQTVPRTIPYAQIRDTFSNKIGLISNAAIAIGQYQYGTKESERLDVTCEQCTILTGLEIDAAKNGVHPDVSLLTQNKNIESCGYLKFKKDFERLKKHKDYHFNQLEHRMDGKKHILRIKNKKDARIEYVEEDGTFINRLPIVFMENLDCKLSVPKNDGSKRRRSQYFIFSKLEEPDVALKGECRQILDTYKYYTELYKKLGEERNKNGDIERTRRALHKLLSRQYDEKNVEKMLSEDIPQIEKQISKKMDSKAEWKELKEGINTSRWLFMNKSDKEKFLRETFALSSLGKEWDCVLQSYNHSYKILWYLVEIAGRSLKPKYETVKEEANKKSGPEGELAERLEEELQEFYKNKTEKASQRIYDQCMEALRNCIKGSENKIQVLFEVTKGKASEERFFWEMFEWEELKPYVVDVTGEEENMDAK